jgi:hypothetical protein
MANRVDDKLHMEHTSILLIIMYDTSDPLSVLVALD